MQAYGHCTNVFTHHRKTDNDSVMEFIYDSYLRRNVLTLLLGRQEEQPACKKTE